MAKIRTTDPVAGDLNRDGLVSLTDLGQSQSEIFTGIASRTDVVSLLGNYGHGMPEPAPSSLAAAITAPVIQAVDQSLSELAGTHRPKVSRAITMRTVPRRVRAVAVDRALADALSESSVRRSSRTRSAVSVLRSHRSGRSDLLAGL